MEPKEGDEFMFTGTSSAIKIGIFTDIQYADRPDKKVEFGVSNRSEKRIYRINDDTSKLTIFVLFLSGRHTNAIFFACIIQAENSN